MSLSTKKIVISIGIGILIGISSLRNFGG